jgi:hypothetical protein
MKPALLAAILVLPPLARIPMSSEAAGPPRILAHGHRGARAMRPENTIPAFEYAIAQGVDALDVARRLTRFQAMSPETNCPVAGSTGTWLET